MSRFDSVETADQLAAFRDRLSEIGVDSTVVQSQSLADELKERVEYPAVGSELKHLDESLPTEIDSDPSFEELKQAATGVTAAQLGVASQGSIVVMSNERLEGPASLYPPKHVAVLAATDIVSDIGSALEVLSTRFEAGANDAVFITGPSSTGDMGESVVGVHGPAEVEVLIVE